MMPKSRISVPWEEIFDEFPEERKEELRASATRECAKRSAVVKFRKLKTLLREDLKSSTCSGIVEIREIEKKRGSITVSISRNS